MNPKRQLLQVKRGHCQDVVVLDPPKTTTHTTPQMFKYKEKKYKEKIELWNVDCRDTNCNLLNVCV